MIRVWFPTLNIQKVIKYVTLLIDLITLILKYLVFFFAQFHQILIWKIWFWLIQKIFHENLFNIHQILGGKKLPSCNKHNFLVVSSQWLKFLTLVNFSPFLRWCFTHHFNLYFTSSRNSRHVICMNMLSTTWKQCNMISKYLHLTFMFEGSHFFNLWLKI